MQKIKVFVSGTYKDIKTERDAINQLLRDMQTKNVSMEFFTSELEPAAASLKELEECDIYLAIIGHRHGTVPPGEKLSITRREYERAYTRWQNKSMSLLIYIASTDTCFVPPDLYENEANQQAQQEFRKELSTRHTPRLPFNSKEELIRRAASDLHNLIVNRPADSRPETIFFEPNEIDRIKEQFDSAIKRQVESVRQCLRLIASNFEGMFSLDNANLLAHPLLSKLDSVLRKAIPEVGLDLEDGKLTRTGVRHVVLRADTFRLLVEGVPPSNLMKLGRTIGKGAATDLTENTIKQKRLIPKSPEALVALWNYWDRTGGWGNIRHETPELKNASTPIAPTPAQPNRPGSDRATTDHANLSDAGSQWRICITHNSLADVNAGSLHDLTDFWCGYISGFLDTALYQLSAIIASLPESERELLTIPAYIRVLSVKCEPDHKDGCNRFLVLFKPEPLSAPLQHLLQAQQSWAIQGYFGTMASARAALREAKELPGLDFERAIDEMGLDPTAKTTLDTILSQARINPQRKAAEDWFGLANLVVQNLATDGVSR